jgi:hypothetical protein
MRWIGSAGKNTSWLFIGIMRQGDQIALRHKAVTQNVVALLDQRLRYAIPVPKLRSSKVMLISRGPQHQDQWMPRGASMRYVSAPVLLMIPGRLLPVCPP